MQIWDWTLKRSAMPLGNAVSDPAANRAAPHPLTQNSNRLIAVVPLITEQKRFISNPH
jgi:hypothetical protein